MGEHKQQHKMAAEDILVIYPFEQQQNAASRMTPENLDRIAEVFKKTWHSLASDGSRNSILGMLTESHISQSLLRTSIATPTNHQQGQAPLHDQSRLPHPCSHQMQQSWFPNNTWNLQGHATVQDPYWQTPFHDQSEPPHPWSHQMQPSWFPNNIWNLQGYAPLQGPYWQTPIPAPRQQNWFQNNRRNLLGKTPVQGQTWPVTTQTPTQQGQYMNGKRPVQGQTWLVTYSNAARSIYEWEMTCPGSIVACNHAGSNVAGSIYEWETTCPRPNLASNHADSNAAGSIYEWETKNRSYNTGIPPNSAGSSQNQGHIVKLAGHMNGLNSGRPAPIIRGQREQMWRTRPEQ